MSNRYPVRFSPAHLFSKRTHMGFACIVLVRLVLHHHSVLVTTERVLEQTFVIANPYATFIA